jgi:hypothetical protein
MKSFGEFLNECSCQINEGGYHGKDNILNGFTFEELETTVKANEKTLDEKAVRKVFKELLDDEIESAQKELDMNIKQIVKNIKK